MTFQILTVNAMTGKTYWQKPHDSFKNAVIHAFKFTRNRADLFVYEIFEEGAIRLLETITHLEVELHIKREKERRHT